MIILTAPESELNLDVITNSGFIVNMPEMVLVSISSFNIKKESLCYNLHDFGVEKARLVKKLFEENESDKIIFMANKYKGKKASYIFKRKDKLFILDVFTGYGVIKEMPSDNFIDGIGELCKLLDIKEVCLYNANPKYQSVPSYPTKSDLERMELEENVYNMFKEKLEHKGLVITDKIYI